MEDPGDRLTPVGLEVVGVERAKLNLGHETLPSNRVGLVNGESARRKPFPSRCRIEGRKATQFGSAK